MVVFLQYSATIKLNGVKGFIFEVENQLLFYYKVCVLEQKQIGLSVL